MYTYIRVNPIYIYIYIYTAVQVRGCPALEGRVPIRRLLHYNTSRQPFLARPPAILVGGHALP